jgi:exopolyphosphatase/guanosine-5'-triphosphate,3'-diphosphate pyrophosphatase
MRVATVDIGTNTVLLLVAEVDSSGGIATLAEEQHIPRLGKGVDAGRRLAADAMARAAAVLEEYLPLIERHHPESVVLAGTSAVRDAANREEFAELVRRKTGHPLEILSGADEAVWTYRGAVSGIPLLTAATVVDIGGGSTEITVGTRGRITHSVSLDVGSVRLTERCLKHDPPTHPELEAAIEVVENTLPAAKDFPFAGTTLVGVAGTATSLAILDRQLPAFSLDAVRNHVLTLDNVHALFRTLREMPVARIRTLSRVMEGRADVITAGALILREIMAHFKFGEMTVSERGVRYGLALREWERRRGNSPTTSSG